MAEKVNLTDGKLKALKPAREGERYEIMDKDVAGLGVRVTDKGKRTFFLLTRYPGSNNPTRRALGEYPTDSLADAREKARKWRKWIDKGKDPKNEEERERLAELRKQADTFDAAVEKYAKRVLAKQRRGDIAKHELDKYFVARWKGRPIASIDRHEVLEVINEAVDRGALYQAHNLLGQVRTFFNWAIATENYGLEHSPCDRIKPKVVIGERKPRQRVLDDAELKTFWSATGKMGYPFGPLFRLLLLTGCRKSEIAEAQRGELDTEKRLLVIPPERFKSEAQHLVPLSDSAIGIIEELPTFTKGEYLFSSTFGDKPVSGFAGAKERLDALMKQELPDGKLKPFRTHDLRRTVRTRLASLRVADAVAEMVIGHGRKGIQWVYDQHTYEDEMRDALKLWAARLQSIVTPPPDNLVRLQKERA
jgi:integrase